MKKVILLSILCVYAQSCPTLCDLLDCSPPGSSVHGISRARILEWVAIPYSRDLLYNLHSVMIHCLVSLKHPPKKKGELSSKQVSCPREGSMASLGCTIGKLGNGAAAQSTYLPMEGGRKGPGAGQGGVGASSPQQWVSRTLKGVGGTQRSPPTPRAVSIQRGETGKATGPGQEEAGSGATTPDQALFLGSVVTPNTVSPLHVNLQTVCLHVHVQF